MNTELEPLIKKFEELRDLLGIRELSDLAWALRGPDVILSEPLKEALTMPIRAVLFWNKDPTKAILENMTPTNLELIFAFLEHMEGDIGHYLNHTDNAIVALNMILDIPRSVYNYARNYIHTIWMAWRAKRMDDEKTYEIAVKRIEELRNCWTMLHLKHVAHEVG